MTVALDFKAKSLHPSVSGWLSNIEDLMIRYFREDSRTEIKLKVLSILEDVLSSCRNLSVNIKLLHCSPRFQNGTNNRDLRCVLNHSTLRCRCRVQNTSQIHVYVMFSQKGHLVKWVWQIFCRGFLVPNVIFFGRNWVPKKPL